jgi:lycopene beta-cyclase
VCGLGPAGRAVAHRALAAGRTVTVIDPRPDRIWTPTYAAWGDELPGWLDAGVVAAAIDGPMAWAVREHRIARSYQVFDTAALQSSLTLHGAKVIADRAVEVHARSVRTAGGLTCTGQVVDARGLARSPRRAEQTAYGVVVERTGLEPTLFMDWRPDNGADPDDPPSFLYAIPLSADTVLFEETCLAGRPALAPQVLRRRLEHRLRARGIADPPRDRIQRRGRARRGGHRCRGRHAVDPERTGRGRPAPRGTTRAAGASAARDTGLLRDVLRFARAPAIFLSVRARRPARHRRRDARTVRRSSAESAPRCRDLGRRRGSPLARTETRRGPGEPGSAGGPAAPPRSCYDRHANAPTRQQDRADEAGRPDLLRALARRHAPRDGVTS